MTDDPDDITTELDEAVVPEDPIGTVTRQAAIRTRAGAGAGAAQTRRVMTEADDPDDIAAELDDAVDPADPIGTVARQAAIRAAQRRAY